MGLWFGTFQFLMPLLGWLLGSSVSQYIEAVDHWVAFGLLAVIGGTPFGMTSLVFYVLVYMAANLAAFGVIASVEQHSGGKVAIEDYNGSTARTPV